MGRHSLPDKDKRGATLGVAVTEAELKRYHAAAKQRGMKLAALVREAVERFLGREPADEAAELEIELELDEGEE